MTFSLIYSDHSLGMNKDSKEGGEAQGEPKEGAS